MASQWSQFIGHLTPRHEISVFTWQLTPESELLAYKIIIKGPAHVRTINSGSSILTRWRIFFTNTSHLSTSNSNIFTYFPIKSTNSSTYNTSSWTLITILKTWRCGGYFPDTEKLSWYVKANSKIQEIPYNHMSINYFPPYFSINLGY